MIENITLINNLPELEENELASMMYRLNLEDTNAWLAARSGKTQKKLPMPKGQNLNRKKEIYATKFDYYIFYSLMNGFISYNDEAMTSRQKRILDAIKTNTLKRFSNIAIQDKDKNTEEDRLNTILLYGEEIYWTDIKSIMKEIESDGGGKFSDSTLRLDLEKLIKSNHVASKKSRASKNKELFAIKDFPSTSAIQLPKPSDIKDRKFKGNSIKVVNPITGITETI
jgi:hypothetical protein